MTYSDQWEVSERIPQHFSDSLYEVMLLGQNRTVERVGMDSTFFTPGTLVFRDCTDPRQNALCDESRITAWRIKGGAS